MATSKHATQCILPLDPCTRFTWVFERFRRKNWANILIISTFAAEIKQYDEDEKRYFVFICSAVVDGCHDSAGRGVADRCVGRVSN